jgi:hypothetical protein
MCHLQIFVRIKCNNINIDLDENNPHLTHSNVRQNV